MHSISEPLPYIPLSQNEKSEFDRIMTIGNNTLLRWYKKVKTKLNLGKSRSLSRCRFRKEIFQQEISKYGTVHIYGLTIPKKDVDKIYAVRNIEWQVICGYSRMVEKIASKWHSRQYDSALGINDFYAEGIAMLFKCCYFYRGNDRKQGNATFHTYAHCSVQRKLMTMLSRNQPLSPYSYEAVLLYEKFESTKKNLNRPSNFEEVIESMGINPVQRKILENVLVNVIHQSSISPSECENGDYTQFSMNFCGLDGNSTWTTTGHRGSLRSLLKDKENDNRLFEYLRQSDFVDSMNLSLIENKVLVAFLKDGQNGWKSKVANENINPTTGKPYTRMNITLTWRKVKNKILEAYRKKEAA